jgi:integrase
MLSTRLVALIERGCPFSSADAPSVTSPSSASPKPFVWHDLSRRCPLDFPSSSCALSSSTYKTMQARRCALKFPVRCLALLICTKCGPNKLPTAVANITKQSKPVTANRVLALLSSIFGWALSAGLWDGNPAKGIRRNAERSRDRFLQADELPRFYAALAEEPNETIRDYFLMSLLTGARRANVLAIRWVEIDFKRAEWRIPRTKNDDPHTIPLMPEALAILVQRQSGGESVHVFAGPGKSGHLIEPKAGWRRIFDRDELTQLTTLVHAAGSRFSIAEGKTLASRSSARDGRRSGCASMEAGRASKMSGFTISAVRSEAGRRGPARASLSLANRLATSLSRPPRSIPGSISIRCTHQWSGQLPRC